jgi:DNA-binding response OmpR family regulator
MRIGVLEDDPAICSILQEFLTLNGHEVAIYDHGVDLLAEVMGEEITALLSPFDILLIDLLLPSDTTGLQVIQQVRMFRPHVPIVIISAASHQDLKAIQRRYSGVQALHKPFKIRDLLAAVVRARSVLYN